MAGNNSQLIKEGYAKSSVNHAARKLKKTQTANAPTEPVPDDIQELRRQKEVIKLQKEIAELEAAKEKLPERMAALEQDVLKLQALLHNAVDTALFISLGAAGFTREEAKEYTDGWVDKNIKG
ncbi:hypothetical protein ACFLX3_05685 [Chloroflexota bacterium]